MRNSLRRREKSFVWFVVLMVLVLLPGKGASQTTLASIEGMIADEGGEGLPGATIVLKNLETGYSYETVSRQDGRYIVSGIEPGRYSLTAALSGFSAYERSGVILNIGSKLKIDIVLMVETLKEEVIVSAETPMVEVTKSEISSVVSREQIENLPLLDRNFSDLAILKAGVQASTRPDIDLKSNALPIGMEESMIDGVSNENIFMGAYRMSIPADAIQEFRVMTNLFAAEYGYSAGMIRSALTRSGTNQYRGRLAFFLRDEMFDTPNYFVDHDGYKGEKIKDVELPDYQHYNFSGFLGGPIKKDKAHFFVSYEGLRQKQYSTITSPLVPQETVDLPGGSHNVLVKLNYQHSEKHLFSFMAAYKRVSAENYYIGGLVTKERALDVIDNRYDFHFHWNFFPSDRTLNEFRVLYAYNGYDVISSDPAFDDAYAIDRPSGLFGKYEWVPQIAWGKRFQVVDNFSLFLGDHTLKIGFDYHYAPGGGEIGLYQPGQFIFETDNPFNAADPMSYPLIFINNIGPRGFEWPQTLASVFVQDSWRASSRLTLNYGLRYNYSTLSDLDIQKFHFPGNINPRFGFSWDPVGDNRTSVRGGVGVYTSNLMGNAAMDISYYSKIQLRMILFPNYPDPNQANPWWPLWELLLGLPSGYLASQGGAQSLAIYKTVEDQVMPYTLQATIGVQREVIRDLSLSADLVYARGYRMLRKENENPVIPGTRVLRPDPTKGDVWILTDNARSEFKGIYFNLNKRYSHGWSFELSYTLGWSKMDSENMDTVASYEADAWSRQYGSADNDARHIFSAASVVDLPLGFQMSGILYFRSAMPWNALYGYDRNLDSLVSDYVDTYRNSRRGFSHFFGNVRVSKYISIDRFRMQIFAEVYNLTNRANFDQIANNQNSPNFGEPTAALAPRQLQFGVRVDF